MNKDKETKKSALPVLLISLAAGALVILAAYIISRPQAAFKLFKIEGCSVYYTDSVGGIKARKVGEFMKKSGIFKSDHEIDIRVDKNAGNYSVFFVTSQDKKYMEMMKALFNELLKMMRADVFAGEDVKLYLCRSNYTECESVE